MSSPNKGAEGTVALIASCIFVLSPQALHIPGSPFDGVSPSSSLPFELSAVCRVSKIDFISVQIDQIGKGKRHSLAKKVCLIYYLPSPMFINLK